MKKFSLIILIAIQTIMFGQIKIKNDYGEKIKQLINKMTLEEKIGQMTQVTLSHFSSRKNASEELKLDEDKLREGIVKYHIGSILNTGDGANSLAKWHEIINMIQDIALKETRLKIPILYGIDAIHGANYVKGATIFPHAITIAASRNRELVKKAAEITAYETKAAGIPWDFNPVLGLGRQPLWARFFETFGEDVYLTSELGSTYIKGLQRNSLADNTSILACMKHYMGYSFPLNGMDRTPAWIPERELREKFLVPFAKAVESGVLTVMVNSSEINGIPAHSDHHLLTEILKGELGFKGFVVSDWEDIKRLYTRDKVAESPKEAVRMAVMAGLDMSMVPYDFSFYNYLLELVKEGTVPEARIDDAVTRILRAKFAAGIFENPYPDKSLEAKFASKEFDKVNKQAAEESIILLKNKNNILPLKKNVKLLVTGPTANLLSVLNGGWTFTWQGNNEKLYPKDKNTIYKAIKNEFGEKNVKHVEGLDFEGNLNIDKAVKTAASVDAIILCLGEAPYCETEGNIDNLSLPQSQIDFAKKMILTGKPVILILAEGRPRVFHEISNGVNGIVLAMLPGMDGGDAIAGILSGKVNPSARLPFTYPSAVNGFMTYDYKPIEFYDVNKFECEYKFGYGLSYTKFNYSNLVISNKNISKYESITVSVDVSNVGDRSGKVSVELYLSDLYGSVSRPNKQLKGFEKIFLPAGKTKTVNFNLTPKDYSFIGRNNTRIIEPGKFIISVDKLKQEFTIK